MWSCHAWHVAHCSKGCVRLAALYFTDRLIGPADSLARHHATFLHPKAVPMRYWRGLCREASRDTQTSIWLAVHLVRAPNSRIGGHEFGSLVWRQLVALTKKGKFMGVRSFYSGELDVVMSCLICSTLSDRLHNARSLACHWQTHLPNTTFLHPRAVLTLYWRELCREACWDTQTSIWLAVHLVRAHNSRTGGHEFGSLGVWWQLVALTKSGKLSLGSGLSTIFFWYFF